ncbi:UbiH/UbiF/VisC/COQ6 family ubiquinone biosynthesis hydroxylase [Roseomonas sp. SSH11]|uniref:UbiH/UbiF/VisC/COQ6 family ubiquinone biosynthesis hydroxylase n=1 Tax=Pararoseomonas baculiformis TaxID=2820812 RepID=A0ABS4AHN9_9PROT|nr:UbiH/UbiF/VisC/COQ6 family ubiquinone biosynthesis hydroxylase [Pararoseomonas baculiformis]MBP0446557.1 UbiH/UbiF/VisC/COQ6 family ubiquinone biosynthesis hydroxylase [Pararoseomonas baculiformis]
MQDLPVMPLEAEATDLDVLVIGAGPAGGTLAATLATGGLSVAVVDSQALPPMELPAFDGRAYAIAAGSRNLLSAAGLWDLLPETPCAITGIDVTDGRPGERPSRLRLRFDAAEMGEEAFGWMVEARSLRVALNARLAALPNLQVLAPMTVTLDRQADGVVARLSDGRVIRARLAVSAEGRRSALRGEAGIGATRLDYRTAGIVCAIAHERPHDGTALEAFLPNGPFAQLPLADASPEGEGERSRAAREGFPHASAIVWSERSDLAPYFMAMPPEAFAREVTRRMGGHLGAVKLVGGRWSYPLSALQAMRFVDRRLALVGDAAHGIHPIAGQGLNVGLRDVAALAELVIEARTAGQDVGSPALLAAYQAARRPDSLVMLGATHALERLFGNDLAPIRIARRLGIAAVDRMPGLKGFFARRAMGMGGGVAAGLLSGRGILPAG